MRVSEHSKSLGHCVELFVHYTTVYMGQHASKYSTSGREPYQDGSASGKDDDQHTYSTGDDVDVCYETMVGCKARNEKV